MLRILSLPALALILSTTAVGARAETVLSVYGGIQGAPHSTVTTTDGTSFTTGWKGKSFAMPPYYGVRATWWMVDLGHPDIGLSIDFSHSKVYADPRDLRTKTPGWTHLEFTDGLNLVTANVFYRFSNTGLPVTPYVGAGLGVSVPHVEVFRPSGQTWNYQLGGPTAQLTAGVDYAISEHFSVFTEYKFNYSKVDVSIDSGARLRTDIITNAINVGLNYKF